MLTEQQLRDETHKLTVNMYDFVDGIESIEGKKSDGKQQLFWYIRKLAELELRIKELEDK